LPKIRSALLEYVYLTRRIPLNLPGDSRGRRYFVVGSVISVFCGALALYLFVHRGGGSLAVSLLDTAALAVLFSASGAALASRRCFVDGADTFSWRTGTAAAIGVCAAAAVWVASLTRETPRGGFSLGMGSGGGSACKHGCPSPQC
jgi:drug/metabolite transporter (DMT)-like permease